MKKIISISLTTVILFFCLVISTFAVTTKPSVSFNDNFTKMYYNGKTFSRVNTSTLDYNYVYPEIYEEFEYDDGVYSESYINDSDEYTVTPNKAHTNVNDISVSSNFKENIFDVNVEYYDGATLSCSFLRDDYRTEYENMISGKADKYTVDFSWFETNEIQIDSGKLKSGQTKKINYYDYTDTFYDVYIEARDKSFRCYSGLIFYSNNTFYYYDYADAGISYYEFFYTDEYINQDIVVREIDDETALQQLNEAKRIYDEESGYIFDDEFAVGISKVFFGILLLLIPLVICIGSLVLFIKAKKPAYKKIFATICVLSLLVIIVVILIIILYNNNITT